MLEQTWTKVVEGKSIKKRPSDNNNQSFEKELAMNTEKWNGQWRRKLTIARYDKHEYSGRRIRRRPKKDSVQSIRWANISKRTV